MNKKTLVALAVAGAMGALASGGVSASTIIDGTSLENYEGIVDRSYQNTESEKISLVVKQVGDATDHKGFTAIGHG